MCIRDSYCREHVEEMKADACANAVFDKDDKRFWHEVYKLSNVKATTNVSTIDGKVGARQIADMWKQYYYEQLYCAKYDCASFYWCMYICVKK